MNWVTEVRARLGVFMPSQPAIPRSRLPLPKSRDVIDDIATPQLPIDRGVPLVTELKPRSHWKVIVRETCEKHGIILTDLLSNRRSSHIVQARHEAMYRMRQETVLSMPEIGERMGGKDHTSVLYAIGRYEQFLAGKAYQIPKDIDAANVRRLRRMNGNKRPRAEAP